MTRTIRGIFLGAMVLALGLGSAGCGGDTGSPPIKESAKMDMQKKKEEMMKQRKAADKGGATGPEGEGEKDKDKDKGKAKEGEKDKE